MSQPQQLLQLQMADTALDQARARLDEIEVALNEDEALAQAGRQLEAARTAHHEGHSALRSLEEEVAALQDKLAANQKALYGGAVTNPKELEDLQREAEALGRHIAALEERQLAALEAFEENEQALRSAEAHAETARTEADRRNRSLADEQKALLGRMTELEREREQLLAGVEARWLDLYKELRGARAGLAVVAVQGDECPACGATLTAALAQTARSPSQLARCGDCGRILVGARP
jgi:predicted  nucleic acid-binding Zn-ribbon protein